MCPVIQHGKKHQKCEIKQNCLCLVSLERRTTITLSETNKLIKHSLARLKVWLRIMCLFKKQKMLRKLEVGVSPSPTGKSLRSVRACVRAICLFGELESQKLRAGPFPFCFWARGSFPFLFWTQGTFLFPFPTVVRLIGYVDFLEFQVS